MRKATSLVLLVGAALLVSGSAFAQGTITGAPPASGAGFTVTLAVPARVGVAWDRNVYFDLGNGVAALAGSCLTYPPAPATLFPCFWEDQATAAGAVIAAPMNVQLFSNVGGAGALVTATVQGAAGNFGTSNATIANVLYAAGGTATCAAGAACGAFTQMTSAAGGTQLAQTASPTAGWATTPATGVKFIFRVPNNLSTTAAATLGTTLSVTAP